MAVKGACVAGPKSRCGENMSMGSDGKLELGDVGLLGDGIPESGDK